MPYIHFLLCIAIVVIKVHTCSHRPYISYVIACSSSQRQRFDAYIRYIELFSIAAVIEKGGQVVIVPRAYASLKAQVIALTALHVSKYLIASCLSYGIVAIEVGVLGRELFISVLP